MEITLNTHRINDDDITVFFTLTDGEDTFKWHGDIPMMDEGLIQAYIESQIETYRCGIYRKIYRDAQIIKGQDETDLQAWEKWIAAGCKNGETAIDAIIWRDTH